MRKFFLYLFMIVILAGAGYYFYANWFTKKEKTLWSLVPGNALAVYESTQIALIWNDLIATSQWKNLNNISNLSSLASEIESLDALTGYKGELDQLTRAQDILISISQVSNVDIDATYFVSLENEVAQRLLARVMDSISSNSNFKVAQRTYQEIQLNEVKYSDDTATFTYFILDNAFVGSFTSFLVEDVVRNLESEENFQESNPQLYSIPRLNNDKGNLYVNYPAVTGFLKNYFSASNTFVETIYGTLSSGFLDLTFDDRNFLLNGFSYAADSSFVGSVSYSTPAESNIDAYVPSNSALLMQVIVGDGTSWKRQLEKYWSKKPTMSGEWESLNKDYGFQIDRFFGWVNGEVAQSVLESSGGRSPGRILYIQTSDINESLNQLNTLTERANNLSSDTLYKEYFSEYAITLLKVEDFPAKVLGKQFGGFDEVFYMPLGNYIVLANKIESLKSLILDIESENTWGKRVSHTSFLENTLEKFNISLIVDIPRAFDLIYSEGSPEFKAFLERNSRAIKNIEKASIQFRNQGDKQYTSMTMQSRDLTRQRPEIDFEEVQKVTFENRVVTKPQIVRNHINGSFEVLVQDSSKLIHMVSNLGELLWSDSLPGKIVGDVAQIDFYKNNKLQFLICLGDHFIILDRNGEKVNDFNLELGYTAVNWSLIDYDRSRNYRILVSDVKGNLYLYNMEGTNLEGWAPRSLSGRLGSPPFHLRIRSRDVIVAVQENGVVDIMNRRGQSITGFPLNLNARTNNGLFIEEGGNFASTVFTLLTNEGELIKFNLEGKVLEREQLFKPNPNTTFKMIIERSNRSFIIFQQDGARLSILDNKGVMQFEKDYLSTTSLLGQYYDFGSGKKLIIVIDPVQEFTYLYNEDGELVNSRPLESGKQVGVVYFESLQKFHIYSTFMESFEISGFHTN